MAQKKNILNWDTLKSPVPNYLKSQIMNKFDLEYPYKYFYLVVYTLLFMIFFFIYLCETLTCILITNESIKGNGNVYSKIIMYIIC